MPFPLTDMEKQYLPTLTRLNQLRQQLSTVHNYHRRKWTETSKYCDPDGLRLLDRDYTDQGGSYRSQAVINPISRETPSVFAAGAMALASNRASEWFSFRPSRRRLTFGKSRRDQEALEYLADLEDTVRDSMANSNFYHALLPAYKDLSVYSNMGIIANKDIHDVYDYRHKAAGSYYVQLDHKGIPRDYYTESSMTTSQIIETYGRDPMTGDLRKDRLPTELVDSITANKYSERYRVIHAVLLNPKYRANQRGLAGAKFVGVHYLADRRAGAGGGGYNPPSGSIPIDGSAYGKLLAYQTHDEHPFLFSPWSRIETDSYGSSGPGDTAIRIIKGLQHAEMRTGQALDYSVIPHFVGSSHLNLNTNDATRLTPGGITFTNDSLALQAGLQPIHKVNWRVDHGEARIARYEQIIRKSFHEDTILRVLSMGDKTHITQMQVNAMLGERLLVLIPMYSRVEPGVLDRAVRLHTNEMANLGLIEDPPDSLKSDDGQGFEMDIVYQSVLAKTERAIQLDRNRNFLALLAQYKEAFPGLGKVLKGAVMGHVLADDMGVSPKTLYTLEEIEMMSQEQHGEQMAMQEAQAEKLRAGAVKDMSTAEKAMAA